jgi:hypothetical protein
MPLPRKTMKQTFEGKKKRAKPQTKAPAQPANISGLLLILEFFELLSEV